MKRPIRASLTFKDLSSDTKFGPSQSRETLPLMLYLKNSNDGNWSVIKYIIIATVLFATCRGKC